MVRTDGGGAVAAGVTPPEWKCKLLIVCKVMVVESLQMSSKHRTRVYRETLERFLTGGLLENEK